MISPRAAEQGIVLLKNEEEILPLPDEIAIIGIMAKNQDIRVQAQSSILPKCAALDFLSLYLAAMRMALQNL